MGEDDVGLKDQNKQRKKYSSNEGVKNLAEELRIKIDKQK